MKGKTGGEGEHTLVDTRGGEGGREGGIAVERRTRREKEGAEAAVAAERGEGGGEKKTSKQLEARRRPHFMLAGIGSL